jgi:hypothetical protein
MRDALNRSRKVLRLRSQKVIDVSDVVALKNLKSFCVSLKAACGVESVSIVQCLDDVKLQAAKRHPTILRCSTVKQEKDC